LVAGGPAVVVFCSLLLFYRLAPQKKLPGRRVWIAAAWATGLLLVAERLFGVYLERFATLNALYGGVAFLRAPQNRAAAVKLIAEIDEIPEPIAAAELDGNIAKLSTTGEFRKEWMERSLEMAKLIGMTALAPVDQMYVSNFKPVPTA
jgi:hypothetical protein